MPKVQALVIHWTANPGQDAMGVWNFFEDRKDGLLVNGQKDYGSAHYVIGLSGQIIRMMPESEVAFHVGSSKLDPASGKDYTDLAREKFGIYATDYIHKSPNSVCIGIEHCVTSSNGDMNDETIMASLDLATDICRRWKLNPKTDILLHKEIVGWKDCHKWYVDHSDAWTNYKNIVATKVAGG